MFKGGTSVHAKFQDPEGIQIAYIPQENQIWGVLSFFWAFFAEEGHLEATQVFKILQEEVRSEK